MQQTSESPSEEQILACLLDFFAASREEQLLKLSDYQKVCVDRRITAHMHNPLVELAEALSDYCGNCTTIQKHPKSFFVGPLSQDMVSTMYELSRKVDAMLDSDQKKLFAVEFLSKNEWQGLRDLARRGLDQWGESKLQCHLSLYDLMCQIVD